MVFLTRLLRVDVCKQSLVTLRKSTGHSFQHCKQALEQTNNDVTQATAWLQAEALKKGWTKLERSEAREAQQGVFAMAGLGSNLVAVTEVNCETDFVARNSELRGFAHKISETLCQEVRKGNLAAGTNLQALPWEKLSQLVMDGQSVDEGRARLVAKIGEKVGLRQSVIVAAKGDERLAATCHPDGAFGKYGAVMLYKGGNDDVAEKICQHIIGMKPMSIGKLEDLNKELSEKDAAQKVQAKSSENAENLNEDADDHTPQARPSKDNEHRLLMQDFVFDPDTTVGELLQEHGMQITRFYRFECAQEMIENKD
ncbi:elongation factor Ts, mitochondrial-like [Varroa jacobsoni]|uniref:elongation factor Ts, mitochondrial-like n=1 Tax=Varroa jacobsoni TaxID=62625 RepID=UPI000BF3FB13|nr:elongation factor Ts, mitochondrial-like [Varroa jacobsoni]XP_022700006.1 elongation factor Ts, mitochondrial-like [Varroa jacobsoni]XP_022700007.1 elongation factor Ts, mitochondrial-like [Varroa jacobsoni]